MELPIKLISTDFDGTIFSEFETPPIPPNLMELIGSLQARGAKWVINTGRDMASLLETLGRSRVHVQPDYLVIVEREIYERQGGRYVGVKHWNDACTADHKVLFDRVRQDVPSLVAWINSQFDASVYDDPHSPICIIAESNQDMDAIHARLDEYCRTAPGLTVVRNDVYARFSHQAYNKGTALAEISRMLNFDRSQVFAVGDHLNDLPMLKREFARCIATPANAVPAVVAAVREQGGFVCSLAQGRGVREALLHFLEGHL